MFRAVANSIVWRFNAIISLLIICGLMSFALLVSLYNYNSTIQDLKDKASNTVQLAALSLKAPIWNLEEVGLENVSRAILLDKDVVALQVTSVDPEEDPLFFEKRGSAQQYTLAEMKNNPDLIPSEIDIRQEDDVIGKVIVITSTIKALELVKNTSILIAGFTVALIAVMAIVMFLIGKKVIRTPIVALEKSAKQLADGDLETEIDTSRSDELGRLAKSFAEMRDSIRKKIGDLHLLNITGETMTSCLDPGCSLGTALTVMAQQTNIKRGSIYLVNMNNNCNCMHVIQKTINHL